jgi:membrane protein
LWYSGDTMKVSISFDQAEQVSPSTYSIYKRLANLGLAIAALIIVVNIWFFSAGQDAEELQAQADQLGRSLITQGAGLAALTLSTEQSSTITAQQLLNQLAEDPHVRSASLHDARGIELNQAGENISITGLFTEKRDASSLIYVQEIIHQGSLQGYLRLILDREQVLQYQTALTKHNSRQTQVLMLLALAIGVLVTRGFYKLRYPLLRQAE